MTREASDRVDARFEGHHQTGSTGGEHNQPVEEQHYSLVPGLLPPWVIRQQCNPKPAYSQFGIRQWMIFYEL
jgi:hypothetical protein